MFEIKDLPSGVRVLSIARKDTPMNIVDGPFLNELEKALDDLSSSNCKGMIITSSNREFVAGADLMMILKMKTWQETYDMVKRIHEVYLKLERLGKPVVTGINGATLGGGYELCLASHRRIAIDNPKTVIGLPEVTLGLLPGAGGTQRLPRIIGFKKSLPYLLQGKKVNPQKALKEGMIDELADSADDMITKAEKWILENEFQEKPWFEKKFKLPGGEVQSPQGYQVFPASTAMLKEKTWGNYPAPEKIMSCVYEGLQVPFERAIEIEAKYFADLASDQVSKNMIQTLFFSLNACNKGVHRPKDFPKTEFQKIGVLGAGMMGAGIAFVTAKAGIPVVLKDVSKESAEKGKGYSEKILKKQIERGRMTEGQAKEILGLITTTDDPKMVEGCDLIVEAVFEDPKLKKQVTEESEAVLPENAVYASNTSTLPITGLADFSKRPANFIGLHFFSPVDRMPLVEIIMGEKTSDETLAKSIDYIKKIKKTPIVVNDSRGFYTSRCFQTYIEEGVACLNDGITPALIENAGKMAGMPVGPLAVADEVSIDLISHIIGQTKAAGAPVPDFLDNTATTFVKDLKRLGRKSGGGFYEYPEGGKKFLWPGLKEQFAPKPELDDLNEVKKRLLYRQSLETAKCLEEKVLTTVRDGDVGSIMGWGFPAYTGGVLSFINHVGIKNFVSDCEEMQKKYGDRFAVPKILKDLADKGEALRD